MLFFGWRMPRKQFWIPFTLLVLTDFYLTTQVYHHPLIWDQAVIYAWYLGAFFLGSLLKDRARPLNILGAGLGCAVSFFLISNFAVWLSGSVGYPKTWSGLIACYTAAIPFFKNGLASDLFFSAVFFSVPAMAASLQRVMRSRAAA